MKKISLISFAVVFGLSMVLTGAMAATTIGTNVSTGGTLTVTGASTLTGNVAAAGTLGVTGVTTLGDKLNMGTSGTPLDFSAYTGYDAGMQIHLTTDFTGAAGSIKGSDIRVTDTAGTAGSVLGTQTVVTKSGGVNNGGSGEMWGNNTIVTLSGGTMTNIYGISGNVTVDTGTTVGADDDTDRNLLAGLFANSFVDTGATLADDMVDAPIIAQVAQSETTGRAKATAAVAAILQGGTTAKSNTAGAAFKVMDYNTTASNNFDYGLDLYFVDAGAGRGYSNEFTTADIRLVNGETIDNGTDGVINMSAANVRSATYNFADATAVAGTANAITIDFSPDFPVLVAGMEVKFVAEFTNAGAATLTIDGGDIKNIYEAGDIAALEAGDIADTMLVHLVYDGTQWQQISQSGN